MHRDTKKTRKPYRKPEILRVRLVPEEAVLATCKYDGHLGGPRGENCLQQLGLACNVAGS